MITDAAIGNEKLLAMQKACIGKEIQSLRYN
jgi:hypothetical protein